MCRKRHVSAFELLAVLSVSTYALTILRHKLTSGKSVIYCRRKTIISRKLDLYYLTLNDMKRKIHNNH